MDRPSAPASPGPSATGGVPPPGTRLRAADAVLEWLLPVRVVASREARVGELELMVPLAATYEAAGGEAAWSWRR